MVKEPETSPVPPETSSRPRTGLASNVRWTFLASAAYALCQWLTLAVVAKVLNAAAVGVFATGLAASALIYSLTSLSLRTVLSADAVRKYRFRDYAFVRVWTNVAGAVIAASALVAGRFYDTEGTVVILLVVFARFWDSLSDLYYGLWQREDQLRWIPMSRAALGLAQTISFGIVLVATKSLVVATAAFAVASVAINVGFDARITRQVLQVGRAGVAWLFDFSSQRMEPAKVLLRSTASLGVVAALDSINANLPRLMLNQAGTAAVGFYSTLASLMMVGGVAISAIGNAASNRLGAYYAKDRRAFFRLLIRLSGIAGLVGLVCVAGSALVGEPVLRVLFTAEFAKYHRELVVMMVAATLWYVATVCSFAMTSAGIYKPQLMIVGSCAAATIATAAVLIPKMGVMAACVALLVGMALRLALTLAVLWRYNLAAQQTV